MPVLHIDDQQFPLRPGVTRLGAAGAADVPVPGAIGVQAIIDLQAEATATISRADPDASVAVNGAAVGPQPMALRDGDQIVVAGVEIRYAETGEPGRPDPAAGASALAGHTAAGPVGDAKLVSLADGREYPVPLTGLVIGRDATADVVVPLAEVSRRHAELAVTSDGYQLTDLSTNGVLVNGSRVAGHRLLQPSDVIRVGSEDFRFLSDEPASAGGATVDADALRSISAPVPPVRAARGTLRFWIWLMLIILIAVAALLVMG